MEQNLKRKSNNWSHRVGAIGNAVNPTVAKYLFECIKEFNKNK